MEHITLVREFFDAFFCQHKISAAEEYLSKDYVQHDYDVPPGRDGFKEHFKKIFSMFPSFRVEVKHIIVDGDMVVVHGYGVTKPGEIEVLVADIYRVEDGRLAEHWGVIQPLPQEQFGNPRLF